MAADGTVTAEAALRIDAGPREVARIAVPAELVPPPGSVTEFLVAEADGLRAFHFAVPDREFALPVPRFDVTVELPAAGPDLIGVVVTAHTLVRDLLLQPDRLGPAATADRGLVTLLPGESVRIAVRGWRTGDGAGSPDRVRAALYCLVPGDGTTHP
jgi:beta-mannosidase